MCGDARGGQARSDGGKRQRRQRRRVDLARAPIEKLLARQAAARIAAAMPNNHRSVIKIVWPDMSSNIYRTQRELRGGIYNSCSSSNAWQRQPAIGIIIRAPPKFTPASASRGSAGSIGASIYFCVWHAIARRNDWRVNAQAASRLAAADLNRPQEIAVSRKSGESFMGDRAPQHPKSTPAALRRPAARYANAAGLRLHDQASTGNAVGRRRNRSCSTCPQARSSARRSKWQNVARRHGVPP